jgi:membrane fusion protein (multidrug efflux system)
MLRRWTGTAALAAGGLLLGAWGCSDGEASRSGFEPRPVVVEIVEVRPQLLREMVDLTGQLDAELSVKLRPDAAGVLTSIEFAEGQAVQQGDVLFRMRDSEQRARLREAEAERDLKRQVYERTRRLSKQDIASAAQLDRARAELEREAARVEAAQAELERTTIRAPFDGMMGALFVAPGARIEPDRVLTQIDKVDRLQVVLTLPEIAIGLARPGIQFEFQVAPYPGETFAGEIYFVAPTVDTETRRVMVKGWAPNSDGRLRPGLFITIRAEVTRREGALVVPESALALDREGMFVWRVGGDDTAERVSVETGYRAEGRVEIAGGLEPGDRIVAAGTNKVRAGSVLRAAAPTSDAGPAPSAGGGSRAEAGEGDGEGS